jgi:MYND finger
MISCHLCEQSHEFARDECDEEREELGLRPGGDRRLTQHSELWGDEVRRRMMLMRSDMEMVRLEKGVDHYQKHPQEWAAKGAELKADERELNDGFLAAVAEVTALGASQCCYWGCDAPDAQELSRCSGCKIVKYCCAEHQKADWTWSHRVECSARVPKLLSTHYATQREAHLRGEYSAQPQ